jgi:hypothetical protein
MEKFKIFDFVGCKNRRMDYGEFVSFLGIVSNVDEKTITFNIIWSKYNKIDAFFIGQ